MAETKKSNPEESRIHYYVVLRTFLYNGDITDRGKLIESKGPVDSPHVNEISYDEYVKMSKENGSKTTKVYDPSRDYSFNRDALDRTVMKYY